MQNNEFALKEAAKNFQKYLDDKTLATALTTEQIHKILRITKLNITQAKQMMDLLNDKLDPNELFNIFKMSDIEFGKDCEKILDYIESLHKTLKAKPLRHIFNYISELNESAYNSNQKLQTQISKLKETNSDLESKLTVAKNSFEKQAAELQQTKKSYEKLKSEVESKTTTSSSSNTSKSSPKSGKQDELLKQKDQQITELQNKITDLNTEINAIDSKLQSYVEIMAAKDAEIADLQNRLNYIQEGYSQNNEYSFNSYSQEFPHLRMVEKAEFDELYNKINKACKENDKEYIVYAIQNRICDVCYEDQSLMHYSAANKNLNVIKVMYEAGFDISREIPYIACGFISADYIEGVDYILRFVDINEKFPEFRNNTLLNIAAKLNAVKVVEHLCLNKEIELNSKDDDGDTALHWSCEGDCINVVKFLANIKSVDINIKDNFGDTPLHRACISGSIKVVKYLCTLPALKINLANNEGNTALHLACEGDNPQTEVAEFLAKQKKILLSKKNNKGVTPLNITNDQKLKKFLKLRGGS